MKTILVFIMVISLNPVIRSQIQMDIKQMTLSGVCQESGRNIIINGNDTILEGTEGIYNLPAIEAIIEIKNISDTSICMFTNNSKIFISYQYKGKRYDNELTAIVKNNNFIAVPNNLELLANNILTLETQGEIVKVGSFLSRELNKIPDFKFFLFEILPTLRFYYRDGKGIVYSQNEILRVDIE